MDYLCKKEIKANNRSRSKELFSELINAMEALKTFSLTERYVDFKLLMDMVFMSWFNFLSY